MSNEPSTSTGDTHVRRDPIWKTRDGRRIPVREMSLDHVRYALRMVDIAAWRCDLDSWAACGYAASAPDGAAMAAEAESSSLLDQADNHRRWALIFRAELQRRAGVP